MGDSGNFRNAKPPARRLLYDIRTKHRRVTQCGIIPAVKRSRTAKPKVSGYRLGKEIGRGGMSVVYSATNDKLKSSHAIKVFDVPECANRATLAAKFVAETRLLASLRHPNIVRVTDCGTASDGRPWCAMDLIEGKSLAVRMSQPDPPSPDEIARWYGEIRSALAYCHSRGIVHGDIKPENIILDGERGAILADFGIARILDEDLRRRVDISSSTLPGNLGSTITLAPECRSGGKATAASDVYSFGVVMHKLVTGIWFDGSPRAFSLIGEYAPGWKALLSDILASDPFDRPDDASQLPETAPPPTVAQEPMLQESECPAATALHNPWWKKPNVWIAVAIFLALALLGYLLERQERNDKIEKRLLFGEEITP